MITNTTIGTHGRLGNQLFQYASLRSLSLNNDYEIKIPNPSDKVWHGQECLLNNFNLKCSYLEQSDFYKLKYKFIENDHIRFYDNFFNLPDNIDLHGFFQNTKYFQKFKNNIIKELTPKDNFIEKAKEEIHSIKQKYLNYEIVSLHIRRGDVTDGTNSNSVISKLYGMNTDLDKNSIYFKYLIKAKNIFINKKVKFLVFSGGSRVSSNYSDLDWCKKNLVGDEYIFSESSDTMSDFSLISVCDHNINCHLTSFGWWASYINKNTNKIVVCPKSYVIPDDSRSEYGFYPKEWIKL